MYSVLIVDDEPMVRLKIKTILSQEKCNFYVCGVAANGKDALELVKQLNPNIILTDLKMPIMGGLELIKSLKDLAFSGKVIILSNYSDFEYVRQALRLGASDYILKISLTEEELISQLQQCCQSLKLSSTAQNNTKDECLDNLIIKNFLLDPLFTLNDFSYQISNMDNSSYYICYFSQPYQDSFHNINGKKIDLKTLHFTIKEIFTYLSADRIISLSPSSSILLIPTIRLEDIDITIRDFATQLQQYTMSFLGLQLLIMISKETYTFSTMKDIYQELKEKEDISFYSPISPIFVEDILLQHYLNFIDYRTYCYELINTYFKNLIFDNLPSFDSLINKCITEKVHPLIIKGYMERIHTYLNIAVSTNDADHISDKIKNSLTIYELKQLMYALFESYSPFFTKHSEIYRSEVFQCIQYIQCHYQENITLDILSRHIGISKNYLCKIFKEDTRCSIIHYINHYRMEKAAQLIAQNNLSIKDISEIVGIHDQFYFNRLFKKFFNMTPSEYKKI